MFLSDSSPPTITLIQFKTHISHTNQILQFFKQQNNCIQTFDSTATTNKCSLKTTFEHYPPRNFIISPSILNSSINFTTSVLFFISKTLIFTASTSFMERSGSRDLSSIHKGSGSVSVSASGSGSGSGSGSVLASEPIIRMKSATNPTEMGGNIAVTVTRSPSLSTRVPTSVCSRILVFALCMHNQASWVR
ncbi:hypothetical protein HanRHA438_Chr05g0245991 [Helianthus annuus]|uniref:uncharacterized protein LOC110942317 n=1 Tax=Helianthus annuus TaxID=4232 RepID=UPI000B90373D|nr:uncharacterized protein LOC110942317 [Helianthus annuus]KAJ0571815.1 hypothetical protein HanHA300_Chr05g0194271 [Helianthus annuus]KAJ0586184.1 hypothetical protein HanHA89_Chr05g0209021 [Helianthus annuus]KAJ0748668.1 hypothetical protein HanOQP8_Chr05g0203621 [Helianthus annuus]KAJ0920866.1 hypothetical protein HanRHA438_Chr05g0245991 [Helianthus annuus]